MAKLNLHQTIRISWLGFASFRSHCEIGNYWFHKVLIFSRCRLESMDFSTMNTATITADVECFNVYWIYLCNSMQTRYNSDRQNKNRASSIPIEFRQLAVLACMCNRCGPRPGPPIRPTPSGAPQAQGLGSATRITDSDEQLGLKQR